MLENAIQFSTRASQPISYIIVLSDPTVKVKYQQEQSRTIRLYQTPVISAASNPNPL